MQSLLIDIGGSGIKYATLRSDEFPVLRNEGRRSNVENSTEGMIAAIAEIYQKFRDEVDNIAVSACMVLDTESGYVYAGGTYNHVCDVNLRDLISRACDDKLVTIESDGDCCLRAELAYGVLQGCKNAAAFVFGSGIGCAFIADGHLIRGHNCAAGEVSWCMADSKYGGGRMTLWGGVSGINFACNRLSKRRGQPEGSANGFDLFRLYREGNKDAVAVLDEMCEEAAKQIFNCCMLLSPEKIAIGGGISSEPELLELICAKMAKHYDAIRYFTSLKCPEIAAAKYHNQANLLGAYARLQETVNEMK